MNTDSATTTNIEGVSESNPLLGLLSSTLVLGQGDASEHSRLTSRATKLGTFIRTFDCTACKLHKPRIEEANGGPVPGEGTGRIMFVGHRIGYKEAVNGRPSIGQRSHYGFRILLTELMRATGREPSREDLRHAREYILEYGYATNAARCGAGEDVRPGLADWKRCGKQWLSQEIRLIDPEIIVFWNKSSAKAVCSGEIPDTGEFGEVDIYGKRIPCFVMYHPAAIGRNSAFEVTVQSQYKNFAFWLQKKGLLVQDKNDPITEQDSATHHWVDTTEKLEQAITRLKNYNWIALDTETKYNITYGQSTQQEINRGAIQWYAKDFDLVCLQLCGLEDDNTVKETFTIACGFLDEFTKAPHQDLTPDQVAFGLDSLLKEPVQNNDGEEVPRVVCMWNAGFDSAVMTRYGVDLLGFFEPSRYNLQIIDGQLLLHRLDEHQSDIQQLSLDKASKRFLGEGKGGGFTQHWPVHVFPYLDVSKDSIRKEVLAYTGGDPELTLLTCLAILGEFEEHIDQVASYTTGAPSALPAIGFGPFPKPGHVHTGSRLWDVATPMDHQMVPVIETMRMIGYRIQNEDFTEVERWVNKRFSDLMSKIRSYESGFNPQSSAHVRRVLDRTLRRFAEGLNEMFKAAQLMLSKKDHEEFREAMLFTCDISPKKVHKKVDLTIMQEAFENLYGEYNTTKDTIEDKFFVYLAASEKKLEKAVLRFRPLKPEDRKTLAAMVPFEGIDLDDLKDFFSAVFLYKQVHKKWSTYFSRFDELVDSNKILHPRFFQRTLSGRFNGNFQNVPRGGGEDEAWVGKVLKASGFDIPKDEKEYQELIRKNHVLDVRQYTRVLQPEDINKQLAVLKPYVGQQPLKVRDEPYVGVFADYAAMEDRYAYALTGDQTKKKLLDNPEIDTHFYNVGFLFGDSFGFDTTNEDGSINEAEVMAAYEHFTKSQAVQTIEQALEVLAEDHSDRAKLQKELKSLKTQVSEYKDSYRTPTKTIHYASQFGAQDNKLHTLLAPIMAMLGKDWSFSQTKNLKARYDLLYSGVTQHREEGMKRLDRVPLVEYAIFGAIRHAKQDVLARKVHHREYLSVMNAENQGACAYICKTAMLRMRHLIEMNAERWNLIQVGGDRFVGINLQVHDEIGIICPAALAKEVALCLESAMKMIVGPPNENTPLDKKGRGVAYWDHDYADHRLETGWLYVPDEAFKGAVLLDADAEVKITIAKAKTLASGEKNLLASMDAKSGTPEHFDTFEAVYPPNGINHEIPLYLARDSHAPCVF